MPAVIDIILPVRNEAPSLPSLLKRIDIAFQNDKKIYTVIAVDDKSTDNSYEVLLQLSKKYPLTVLRKKGRLGKAYSIIQGAKQGNAPFVGMIDADLEYPPEALPALLEVAKEKGMAVAKRVSSHHSKVRVLLSKGFQFIFGRLLFGFTCDVQSGLKVFRREIIEQLDSDSVSGWTIDIPLLESSRGLNFEIGEVPITFSPRKSGQSKINLWQSVTEIGGQAIKYKLAPQVKSVSGPDSTSMLGAGIVKRHKRFITHTTLHPHLSAAQTFTNHQQLFILMVFMSLILGLILGPITTLKIVVAVLSFIYFIDVIFNLFIIMRSLHSPPEISPNDESIQALQDKDLPIYSIMCPLYKEANILPYFLEAIEKMDWPKNKLDVMLLLEEDDKQTIEVAKKLNLPSYFRILVVPDSQPKTKPKACNFGLSHAKGEYLVIYDAEDIPDPLQLKKVYLGFQQVPQNVVCLQAKLNYHNPHQNLLTRFFTAEYSLWFDVVLTGLQTIQTTLPLGGTSNHFKTKDLLTLKGWDPFNVTEDCDLGVRLFKRGFKTAIIDSVTLEEANSNWKNWLRQRSRWIKGYMQTYLIHMRNPVYFFRKNGLHALLFQLIVGGKIAFMLINPIMWLLTISYFALYQYVGPTIETFYPAIVFYMAVISLLFGNFLFIYYYMIGVAKREHWALMKWIFLIPIYWLMVSVASIIALYQLIVKPHYWEKTIHGLHLKKEEIKEELEAGTEEVLAAVLTEAREQTQRVEKTKLFGFSFTKIREFFQFRQTLQRKRSFKTIFRDIMLGKYRTGTLLVIATILANFLNMGTNFFLGHALNLTNFAIFNTYLSILSIFSIFTGALSMTINHQAATLFGKVNQSAARNFWLYQKNRFLLFSSILTIIWLILLPFTTNFFGFDSIFPMLFFSPILMVGAVLAINQGYLKGSLSFGLIAITTLAQPLIRLLSALLFGFSQVEYLAYLCIPIAFISVTVISYFFARRGEIAPVPHKELRLPKTFFLLTLVASLSSIAFFSLDNIIVAHYLSLEDTGLYGIMGLLGKMIFFTGSLITGFILPITAFREGKGLSSDDIFKKLIVLATTLSTIAFIVFGLAVPLLAPAFLGVKINAVRTLLPFYSFGILLYTLSQAIVQFHLAKKQYLFAVAPFFIALIQVIALMLFHNSLTEVTITMCVSGTLNLVILSLLHVYYKQLKTPLQNFYDFGDLLFGRLKFQPRTLEQKDSYRILIFNWRDIKHVWSGGAEVYIHEIAKEFVGQGHKVTIFCGNDGRNPRNEVIDGIQIVRRGGFYTVYVWAFLYYVLRFRNTFDVIIDSENGIPFLTPLYVKKPIFLLIHHVHQEIFRSQLKFPLSEIASIIESDLMTSLYKHHNIITVSESSKQEILDLGLGERSSIQVISPGINQSLFHPKEKTVEPSLVYVGRLKPYKRIDIALKAFALVLKNFPKATFTIAGSGESLRTLQKLAEQLKINNSVKFLQNIEDKEKATLFAKSWVAVQPSTIEGWGITVIEANASGTPVVASKVKGLQDSVSHGKSGLLVKVNDSKAFAEAIDLLFKSSRLRKSMSKSAIEWAQEFSWNKSGQLLLSIILRSVKEKKEQTVYMNASNSAAKAYDKIN